MGKYAPKPIAHYDLLMDRRIMDRVVARLNKPTNFLYPSQSHLIEALLRQWLKEK